MSKIYKTYKIILPYVKKIVGIFVFSFFIFMFFHSLFGIKKKGYYIFVEFNDAYSLKEGTFVNYKGIKVGVVTRLSVNLNKVVILLKFNSNNLLIPSNSVFEVNQIGIFNDIVINIIPPKDYLLYDSKNSMSFLVPNSYVKGYKGISYDDLIRSTTRISQRFDDPRFFSLFYLFLRNTIYLSDEVLILIHNFNSLLTILTDFRGSSIVTDLTKD